MANRKTSQGMASWSACTGDPFYDWDACSNHPDLVLCRKLNVPVRMLALGNVIVDQDCDLCLCPTGDVGFSHVDLLQLSDDASLMGSVEALPCRRGRHLEKATRETVDGVVDGNARDYG